MESKLAVVTGTSSGIGLALARRLTERGWAVIGLARREAPVTADTYTHLQVDLGETDALQATIETVLRTAFASEPPSRLALVNNAALVGALSWMREYDAASLQKMFAVNATAPVVLMGAFSKHRPASSRLRVVNVSSGAAHTGIPGLGDYCATKAALRIAGQTLAAELERAGLTPRDAAVFSYEPGLVETQMQVTARGTSPERFPGHTTFTGFAEQGLLNAPEDVVEPMVAFLESDPEAFFSESRFGA